MDENIYAVDRPSKCYTIKTNLFLSFSFKIRDDTFFIRVSIQGYLYILISHKIILTFFIFLLKICKIHSSFTLDEKLVVQQIIIMIMDHQQLKQVQHLKTFIRIPQKLF